MKPVQTNFFLRVVSSFGYAFRGIRIFLAKPSNAWVHLIAAVVVCAGGYYFRINATEWMAIVFAIGFVFAAEMVNSSIETLTDLVSPDYNKLAGKVKDMAAGAVLVAAITAVVIACVIFLPRLV